MSASDRVEMESSDWEDGAAAEEEGVCISCVNGGFFCSAGAALVDVPVVVLEQKLRLLHRAAAVDRVGKD